MPTRKTIGREDIGYPEGRTITNELGRFHPPGTNTRYMHEMRTVHNCDTPSQFAFQTTGTIATLPLRRTSKQVSRTNGNKQTIQTITSANRAHVYERQQWPANGHNNSNRKTEAAHGTDSHANKRGDVVNECSGSPARYKPPCYDCVYVPS
jgi:hypothetical protein